MSIKDTIVNPYFLRLKIETSERIDIHQQIRETQKMIRLIVDAISELQSKHRWYPIHYSGTTY